MYCRCKDPVLHIIQAGRLLLITYKCKYSQYYIELLIGSTYCNTYMRNESCIVTTVWFIADEPVFVESLDWFSHRQHQLIANRSHILDGRLCTSWVGADAQHWNQLLLLIVAPECRSNQIVRLTTAAFKGESFAVTILLCHCLDNGFAHRVFGTFALDSVKQIEY